MCCILAEHLAHRPAQHLWIMGELEVEKLVGSPNKAPYIRQLLNDIEALEHMLKHDLFERAPIRIGAEQEFCLVNESWEPAQAAMEILNEINDEHFTSELALYNLEINLDPIQLKGRCFSKMHEELNRLLDKAKKAAKNHRAKVLLSGILPTIEARHLEMSFMTPAKRYVVLNEAIKELRRYDIELHIKGVDEVNLRHDSILYEGCNTSFQSHLQIDPADFRDSYNWAQAIAGPILSVCTNSPLLMGRELWAETRIALFTQSIDTRASTFILNHRDSRVNFGNDWARGSLVDFFKDSIIGFRSLITSDFESDSLAELHRGHIPKLKALGLHNGTVYKWNRPCYGVGNGKPHVRIENRYMPAGPSVQDEMANMMFWVGVMRGRPDAFKEIHTKMDFKDAKGNFFNAARYGLAAQFYWNGTLYTSQELLLDVFLPMAYKGLYAMDVAPKDAEHYLSIIENRVRTQCGSRWTISALRNLMKKHKTPDALKILTATMYKRQQKGYPVDAWQLPRGDEAVFTQEKKTVGQCMNTKTITAQENDSAALVLKMMQWKNIHHVPILDRRLKLVGLLSWTDVQNFLEHPEKGDQRVANMMQKKLITATPEMQMTQARALMASKEINCLPVVAGQQLLGIITSNDF